MAIPHRGSTLQELHCALRATVSPEATGVAGLVGLLALLSLGVPIAVGMGLCGSIGLAILLSPEHWFEGRKLTFNAAGFYNDYRDIQLTVQTADPMTGMNVRTTQNAGRS